VTGTGWGVFILADKNEKSQIGGTLGKKKKKQKHPKKKRVQPKKKTLTGWAHCWGGVGVGGGSFSGGCEKKGKNVGLANNLTKWGGTPQKREKT